MMDIPKPVIYSSLSLFPKPELLVTFDNSLEQENSPVTSSNAPVVESVLTTDGNIYLDRQKHELKVETNIGKGANDNTNLDTEVVDAATVLIAGDGVAFFEQHTSLTRHSTVTC